MRDRIITLIFGMVAVLIIFIAFVTWMAFHPPAKPSVAFDFATVALLILVGLAAFIGLMNFLSFCAHWIGISDPRQAFGLPEGTVRAILTVAFIVLVGVLASYLLTHSEGRVSFAKDPIVIKGISEADAQQLVLRLSSEGLAVAVAGTGSNPGTRDIQFFARSDYRLADDVAKQVLTILSTILAAMIGFYFGARPGDAPRTDDPAERSRLLAELNGLIAKEPTPDAVRKALDPKLAITEPEKKKAVDKAKADLAEIDQKVEAARKSLADLSLPIDKVRAAQADAKTALGKLPDLKQQIEKI